MVASAQLARPVLPTLPRQITPFIGRERELADLRDRLLAPDTRLVTLTGPGGIGKSRLALEAAAGLAERYPGGVTFVPLAQLADPALAPAAVGHALGVKESGRIPLADLLAQRLGGAPHLLILDNFEHLLAPAPDDSTPGAAPFVSSLLTVRGVAVLVTSREVLRLYGEQVVPVPPLDLPAAVAAPPDGSEAASDAVRLFLQRARAVCPNLPTGPDDLRAMAEICRRVDGLPLGIELAAARAAVLPPRALLERLETRLPFLTGGPRDVPARQRTLRDAIAWSYDLLSPEEQALFRRMAVFRGAALAAIEAVCCAASGGPRSSSVAVAPLETYHGPEGALDGVTSLVQKSLLSTGPSADGEPRCAMLETIREFALERLRESGELEQVQRRHILLFLELAETAEPHLAGPEQARWYARLEQEHDNLREALRVCEERGYADPALRLATALWWFWFVRGHAAEARERFARLLERFPARASDGVRAHRRAKALEAAGRLAAFQNDPAAARALQQEALGILEELRDRAGIFAVLQGLALAAEQERDFDAARVYLERALAGARDLGDPLSIGTALCNLGPLLHAQGETAAARAMIREALTLYEQAGNLRGQCHGWLSFGLLAYDEADYDAARAHVEHALALYRRMADPRATAIPLASLARIAVAQRAYADAERHLRAALEIESDVGDAAGTAFVLERWAELDAVRGEGERAMTLAGAAEAVRAGAGVPLRPAEQTRHESQLRAARDALSPDAARAARARGAALADSGDAVAFALGADRATGAPPPTPATPAARPSGQERPVMSASAAGSLSPREREVSALIAQGKTNRQIAAALVITEGTAANHVLHILTKLGFTSRAQIAAWAVDHRLT